jgi:hypothetical protein
MIYKAMQTFNLLRASFFNVFLVAATRVSVFLLLFQERSADLRAFCKLFQNFRAVQLVFYCAAFRSFHTLDFAVNFLILHEIHWIHVQGLQSHFITTSIF